VANWHARVNVVTLLIFIVNFYLEHRVGVAWIGDMPMLRLALSIIGVVGLAIAGWLGGQLVSHMALP
jgi:uncharacterized membrane protein